MEPTLRLLCFVGLLPIVGACSGTHEGHPDPAVHVAAMPVRNVPRLNVPGLVALSIDALSLRLEPHTPLPADYDDPTRVSLGYRGVPIDSVALFRNRELSIVAAYDNRTRQVSELLLLGNDESDLMYRGQLRLGAANYIVLPAFQTKHPTKLMGLRVVATAVGSPPAVSSK